MWEKISIYLTKNFHVGYIKNFHKSKRKKMAIQLKNNESFKQESHKKKYQNGQLYGKIQNIISLQIKAN